MTSRRALVAAALAPTLIAGCAADLSKYVSPPTTLPPAEFVSAAGATQDAPDPFWWEGFNDPALNALIKQALLANREIRAAEADLRRARATARLQGWTLLPRGTLSADYSRQRQAVAGFRQPGAPSGPLLPPDDDVDFYSGGLEASWEPDVFGRLRGEVRASRAESLAADAARRGARVAIAAEVSAQYVGLRAAQARLEAARANAETQRETLRLTQALREAGRGTRLDVARAVEQLAATEAAAATLEADVHAAYATLAVLVGAGGVATLETLLNPAPIPAPPNAFGVGDPEALLQRRPDIVQARAQLIAAANRAAARGDWWPRLTFAGNASVSAFSVDDLSSQSAFGFAIGPRLEWPIINFRRNQLAQRAREAGAEAEYERFDETVARAFADAEIALVSLSTARRAAAFARQGAEAAREAAELARLRYREGVDPFFAVLDAERRLAEAEDRRAQADALAATAYVRLGQALGAGWQEPAPADETKADEAQAEASPLNP